MNIGDYVRTEDGIKRIAKYEYRPRYENCHCIWFENENCGLLFTDEELFNSSPNIMDLIEENDYIRTINDTDFRRVYMSYGNLVIEKHGLELSIKKLKLAEIITSQQFPQMTYKVGNNNE